MIRNYALVITVVILLGIATGIGRWLRKQESRHVDRRAVESYNARIQAWWFFGILLVAAFFSPGLTVVLFAGLSFRALREFITLTPTRIGDHRALFWVFLFFTPMQFLLVWYDNYGLYSILIPVYAFLFIAVRAAISGDFDRFLERIAKVQCGLMICVYCLSFAPAMLYLQLQSDARGEDPYAQQRMLCFFVTIVLLADLLEWVWSRIYGQHIIAEKIDPQLSWEGVLASAVCVSVAGAALYWATPFSNFWQSAAMSLLIALMAAAGSLAMAAIKRDRGDLVTGAFTEGQGGVLSRIDSICFAAPVFYHVTRYFFAAG